MSKNKPKSLADIIGSEKSGLGQLADAAQLRADLSAYLRKKLSAELAAAILHCNIHDDGTLVVLASSPEWASRLRFESDRLIELCQQRGMAINGVKIRVSY